MLLFFIVENFKYSFSRQEKELVKKLKFVKT